MKKVILLLASFVSLCALHAQLPDTIHVSTKGTLSLVFPDSISLVNIGSNDYVFEYDQRMLLIKIVNKNEGLTSLVVRYGVNRYFACYLGYRNELAQFHYDLRTIEGEIIERRDSVTAPLDQLWRKPISPNVTALDMLPKDISKQMIQAHLVQLDSLKRELFTVGAHANNIEVSVENVRNDQALSYFKLSMSNQSSIPYLVEFVGFQYREPARKKGLSDMVTELQTVMYQVPDTVGAYGKASFLFAIPHFATPKRGRLEIIFRERNGTRAISFQAPSNLVLRAKII